ncbi:hypothetical protein [Coriobacterium glomerans]|nr:hypothetical protein [Coriobacterium glomerans]
MSIFNLCLGHLMMQTKSVLSQTGRQSFCRRDEDCSAFCGQDDKWLARKREYAVAALDDRAAQALDSLPYPYFYHCVSCDRELDPGSDQALHPKDVSFRNALSGVPEFDMILVANHSFSKKMIWSNQAIFEYEQRCSKRARPSHAVKMQSMNPSTRWRLSPVGYSIRGDTIDWMLML